MIAFCGVCGQLVRGKEIPGIAPDPETKAKAELQEFDNLAGAMLHHIFERHTKRTGPEPSAGDQLSAVMNLSGKVYAMSHAQTPAATETDAARQFVQLRDAWRESVQRALFPIAYADGTADGTAAPSSAPPAGS
jgi:hypothetical protein